MLLKDTFKRLVFLYFSPEFQSKHSDENGTFYCRFGSIYRNPFGALCLSKQTGVIIVTKLSGLLKEKKPSKARLIKTQKSIKHFDT